MCVCVCVCVCVCLMFDVAYHMFCRSNSIIAKTRLSGSAHTQFGLGLYDLHLATFNTKEEYIYFKGGNFFILFSHPFEKGHSKRNLIIRPPF